MMEPKICIGLLGARDIRYFQTKQFFYFHMSIFNQFRNKIVSASDARLFCKNKQVNFKNKRKRGYLTEKQAQHALAGKSNGTKNYQEN